MDGRANDALLPGNLQLPQTDVGLYHSGGGSLPSGSFVDLAPGSGTDFGPEVTLGRTLADAFPDESFALIKHAVGGSDLFGDWDPNTGSQYNTFTNTVQAGLQAIIDAGDTPNIIGMAWMQGEADAVQSRTEAQYTADLTEFIQAVRDDFAGGSDMRFVIGRLSDMQFTGSNIAPFREGIQAAQDQVAASMTNVGIFNTDTYTLNDDRHFDAAGQQQLGISFANELADIVTPPPNPTGSGARFDLGRSGDEGSFEESGWTQFELGSNTSNPSTSVVDADTGWSITLTRTDGSTLAGGRNRDPYDAALGGAFTLDDVYIDFIVGFQELAINNLDPSKVYDVQFIMFDDNVNDGRTQDVTNVTDGVSDFLGNSAGPGVGSGGVLESDQAYSVFGTGLSPDASGVLEFEFFNDTVDNGRSILNGLIITEANVLDPADLDLDGDVDDADFALFFAAFSGPGVPSGNPAADLDGDTDTDDADFGLAFAAFTGPGTPAASVPEPASLVGLILGGIFARRRRSVTRLYEHI